jgi:hypothetical protein
MLGQESNALAPADSAVPFMNAIEPWAIYDTIQIREDLPKEKWGYPSYATLGAARRWGFFDQRKASEVGIAYTNRDSNEALEFAFEIFSMGVRFVAPEGKVEEVFAGPLGPDNPKINMIFSRMIMEHVGFRLKVSQDEKLIHSCYLAPDGLGPGNVSVLGTNAALSIYDVGSYSNTNGDPHPSGRWKFPTPLEMPRGVTFKIEMEPSDYCAELLQAMWGPSGYTFSDPDGPDVSVASCALIRVDLFGRRGVQRRNSLHFAA